MKENTTKDFFQGAMLLTLAGLVSKVLSAGYRIPLQNITGDIGFYIYQQVYPFLGITMILALYGFPSAISKMVAEKNAQSNNRVSSAFFYRILLVIFLFSSFLAAGLFLLAPFIAQLMGDEELTLSLQIAAFVFLFIPFVSSYRGFFQGFHYMQPTAFSQIVDQLIRVSVIIGLSIYVMKTGNSLYQIGVGGSVASLLGALGATVFLYFSFKQSSLLRHNNVPMISWREAFRGILVFGIVMTINHMLLLLFQLVDAFTLVAGLEQHGYQLQQAKMWKGIFDRGQPLIQLGVVLGSSLALALLPTINSQQFKNQYQLFINYIQGTWKFSLYISSAAASGLITIFPYANQLLFTSTVGTTTLQILAITIVFAGLSITTASILQGLGYMYRTALFVLVGVIVKLLLNLWLVPLFGTTGGAMATAGSALFVLLCNVGQLNFILRGKVIQIPWIRFIVSLTGLVAVVASINQFIFPLLHVQSRWGYCFYVVVTIMIGASIYFLLLIKLRTFTKEELEFLPFQKVIKYIAGG